MATHSADEFGFSKDVLPEQLEGLVEQLEQADADPHTGRTSQRKHKKQAKSGYRTEAEHYWEEACDSQFENPNDFIAHAIGAFRAAYQRELNRLEE